MTVPARTQAPSDWDPLDPAALADPLAAHAELRRRCPVAHSDQWEGFWSLTKYADICAAARDTETFSSDSPSIPPFVFEQEGPMGVPINLDPPHTRKYRQLLGPYFTPKRMAAMDGEYRALADECLDAAIERGRGELVAELTYPYPSSVLCQCVLRSPRSDWPLIKQLTADVQRAGIAGDHEGVAAIGRKMNAYITDLVVARRAHPLDPDEDMISGLIEATVDDAPLSDATISAVMRTMMVGGHDTTTLTLGSAILHLAEHPEDQARLRADPSAIPAAIEEILRCYTPIQQLARRTTRDVDVRGRTIPAGATVGLMFISGNHDEDAFPDPDTVILDRTPNKHIGFGFGVHHCIGAPLARAELRVALEQLLGRTTHFELDGSVEEWSVLPTFGPKSLPIRLEARHER